MAQSNPNYVERYVPANTSTGWGIATGIVLLALAFAATATYIHKETYKHPTDVTWHGKGSGDTAPLDTGSVVH
jgi:hypothetical protein